MAKGPMQYMQYSIVRGLMTMIRVVIYRVDMVDLGEFIRDLGVYA